MPLGLRFFPTPKKSRRTAGTESSDGTELKTLSDPSINLSIGSGSAGFVCKSESVHVLQDYSNVASPEVCDEFGIPAEMSASFFDRNGNPVDDDEGKRTEPKCFINAAQLLDEEPEYVPTPPLSLVCDTVKPKVSPSGIPIRRRVPISKSFPDIIQTAMQMQPRPDFDFKTGKPMEESIIVADSLEEIRTTQPICTDSRRNSVDVTATPVRRSSARVFDRIEPILTESVISLGSGITSEKPPETWIVDFNSFTSDDEDKIRHRRKSTSSTNSLAYFLSMDEVDCPATTTGSTSAEDPLTTSTDSKKIFSMFVDLAGKDKSKLVLSTAVNPGVESSPATRRKLDSNLRYKAMSSGIPRSFPTGVKGHQDHSGSMSSSMLISSVSDGDRSFFPVSNKSSLHVANHEHDGSFSSSFFSSMEMSAPDGGDSDVCQGGACFKLGMDLLRMFQEGINTDVAISVRGRFVKAHKCILASRSQYFAAILSGNWIQKAGNTIHLDEFSYTTVQFTMYHIYSGTNEIPEVIDLMELATLTDMLGLEGLREVISQTIRNRFCHNFHRPCTGCIAGVLEFFPLAVSNPMDELQRKMTKWICKHFVRIWPTKAFGTLGQPLIDKCLGFSVSHLSPENLLDVALGCDQLVSTMPTVRWTEGILSTVNQLHVACIHYVGDHLNEVLQSQRFLLFGKGQTWNISRIENTFLEGILLLKADEACLSHVALCRLIELGTVTIDEVEWSTIFVNFLKILRKEVEKFFLSNASKAVLSKNWELLSQDVRKRICATSFHGADKTGKKPPKPATNTTPVPVPAPRKSSAQSPNIAHPPPTPRTSKMSSEIKGSKHNPDSPVVSHVRIPSPVPISETAQKWTSTKSVASVKPMQSQPQTPVTPSTVKMPNVYASGRPVSNTGTWTKPKTVKPEARPPVATPTVEPVPKRKQSMATGGLLQKERSFDTVTVSSSRVSSAGSGPLPRRGSVSRPTTNTKPSVVAAPRPTNPPLPVSKTMPRQKPIPIPEPLPLPTTKFLTNSEKAKAVSKPKLVFRGQRSNSVSTEPPPLSPLPPEVKSHSRQSSMGSNVKAKTNSEKTIKPPASPRVPRSSRFSNVTVVPKQAESRDLSKPVSGHSTGTYRISRTRGTGGNVRGKGDRESQGRQRGKGVDTGRWSSMSKSSIDMESSEEPRIRTLAEIGRSSTFSKDEPTVIGKMDTSVHYALD